MIFDPVQVKLAAGLSEQCDRYLEALAQKKAADLSDALTFRDWLGENAPADLPRWNQLCRAMANNPPGKDTNQNLPLIELLAFGLASELCAGRTVPDEEALSAAVNLLARKHCKLLVVYQADHRLQNHPGNKTADLSSLWELLQYNQKTTGSLRPCTSAPNPFNKICSDCQKRGEPKKKTSSPSSKRKDPLLLKPNEISYRRTLLDACAEFLHGAEPPRKGLPEALFQRLNGQSDVNRVTGAAVAWQTLNHAPAAGSWLRQFHLSWRGVVLSGASLPKMMTNFGRPLGSSAADTAEAPLPLFEYTLFDEVSPAAWYVRQNPALSADCISSALLEQEDLGFLLPLCAEAMLTLPGSSKTGPAQIAKRAVWKGLPALKTAYAASGLAELPNASLEDYLFFLCRSVSPDARKLLAGDASAETLPLEKLVEDAALQNAFRGFLEYCSKQKKAAFPLCRNKTLYAELWAQYQAQPGSMPEKNSSND